MWHEANKCVTDSSGDVQAQVSGTSGYVYSGGRGGLTVVPSWEEGGRWNKIQCCKWSRGPGVVAVSGLEEPKLRGPVIA